MNNIETIIQKLEKLKQALISGENDAAISTALAFGLGVGMSGMKTRIFNNRTDAEGLSLGTYTGQKGKITKRKFGKNVDNEAPLDAASEKIRKKVRKKFDQINSDNPLGTYTEYQKTRLAAGRQIETKDLEFEGDLRRDIQVVEQSEGKATISLPNEKLRAIAKYQEQQIGNIRAGQNTKTGKATPAKIFAFNQDEKEETISSAKSALQSLFSKLIEG